MSIMARTTPEQLPDAARRLQEVLASLAHPDFIADEDVIAAKASLRVGRAFLFERTASVAHQVAAHWSNRNLGFFEGYEAAVESVTPEAVRAFMVEYLGHGPRVVGVLLSEETIQAYREPILRSLEGWIRP
jgi:predicted Zn-dependent peptidase